MSSRQFFNSLTPSITVMEKGFEHCGRNSHRRVSVQTIKGMELMQHTRSKPSVNLQLCNKNNKSKKQVSEGVYSGLI